MSRLPAPIARHRNDVRDLALRVAAAVPVHRIRVGIVRALGAHVPESVTLYGGFEIRKPAGLRLGERCIIGDRAVLDARGGLTMGDDVNLSSEVQIYTAQHDWKAAQFDYVKAGVTIGDRVWLGPRVTVLPGAEIGSGARVAAGAVVRGRLRANTLYGGVPAHELGQVPTELTYHLPGPGSKLWWR